MSFTAIVNGSYFFIFLKGIQSVQDNAVISFGHEKIVCNAFSDSGEVLFSGMILPFKTTLREIVELDLPIAEMVEQFSGEAELPEYVVIQFDDTTGVLEVYPNVKELDTQIEEILISQVDQIKSGKCLSLPPRINYPIKFFIDVDIFIEMMRKLKTTPSTIISFEEGVLFFANEDWSDKIEILPEQYNITSKTRGSFSSMFNTNILMGCLEVLNDFSSTKVGLGEDLPLVMASYAPEVCLAYMQAQQMEEK